MYCLEIFEMISESRPDVPVLCLEALFAVVVVVVVLEAVLGSRGGEGPDAMI